MRGAVLSLSNAPGTLGWFVMLIRLSLGLRFSKSWALNSHSYRGCGLPQECVACIEIADFQAKLTCPIEMEEKWQLPSLEFHFGHSWFYTLFGNKVLFAKRLLRLERTLLGYTWLWQTTAEPIQMQIGSVCFFLIWLKVSWFLLYIKELHWKIKLSNINVRTWTRSYWIFCVFYC